MPVIRRIRPLVRQSHISRSIASSCRCYSEAKTQQNDPEIQGDEGAMHRRLQSLAEEAEGIPEHFRTTPESTLTDADLLKLQDRLSQASFQRAFPRAQGEANLPQSVGKLTRDIAADEPWTGEESTSDAVLRMLTDVHKPLQMPATKPTLGSLPLRGAKRPATPKSATGRALAAKEASQGYSLLKEKLSPGFRSMPASMEGLASLAEEKIQEARARGEFKNLPGRGKPAAKDYLDESPHLDRTEYFLNRILQRQGAAPPWVQAQIDLTSDFASFRKSIREEWLRHVTRQITTAPRSVSSHIARAESFVERDTAAYYTLREYRGEWESREAKYHTLAVEDLNMKTRSYNTIAPYTARRPYTTLQKELESCYKDVAPQIVSAIRNRSTSPPPKVEVKPFVRGIGILEDLSGQKQQLHVNRDGEYGLMDFIRGFIKRDRR